MERYETGIGRTLRESAPLLTSTDVVIVQRAVEFPFGCRVIATHGGPKLVTLQGLAGRLDAPSVWQPWTFGPLGTGRTLLGVYDLIPRLLGRSKKQLFDRRLIHVADDESVNILTLHESTKARLTAEYRIPDSRIFVATPGVSLKHESRNGVSEPNQKLIFIGRCSPHKNLDLVIDAWTGAGRPGRLSLIVPRSDGRHPSIQKARSAGAEIRHGLTDEQISRELSGCAALLAPSLDEGFGLPLVEAAALGAPIIASSIGVYRSAPVIGASLISATDAESWKRMMVVAVKRKLPPTSLTDVPTWDDWRGGVSAAFQGTFGTE